MKKSSVLLAALGGLVFWNTTSVLAAPPSILESTIKLPTGNERYGCCLVKSSQGFDVWEYQDEVSYLKCYRQARLAGEPWVFSNNQKYEFHQGKRCDTLQDKTREFIPTPWAQDYRNG